MMAMGMEMRLEQQPQPRQRQRQRQRQRGEQVMGIDAQWRTDITRQMGDMARAQQDTALALERILGRLNGVERWQEDADERRERQEERRDSRDDKAPDQLRANVAILLSALSAGVYVITLLAAHWKP